MIRGIHVIVILFVVATLAGCAMRSNKWYDMHASQAEHDQAVALRVWNQIEQRYVAGHMGAEEWRHAQDAYRSMAAAQEAYIRDARKGRDTSNSRAQQQRALRVLMAIAKAHGVNVEDTL